MKNGAIRVSCTLTHAVGLHARPAVRLTQLAAGFVSEVQVRLGDGGGWIDAKSIVKVIRLKARPGDVLYLRASGDDAEQAVQALVTLVEQEIG